MRCSVRRATLGANEMVISTLTHTINHHEYEGGGFRRHFFIVSMHVLGTAIALGAHEPHPAPSARRSCRSTSAFSPPPPLQESI